MNCVKQRLFGEKSELYLLAPVGIKFPSRFIQEFPSCCGAGDGIGNLVVPETILGLRVSAACFVHDYMWDHAEPTWKYFHYTNSIFGHNLAEIINTQSANSLMRMLRKLPAYNAEKLVDTVGAAIFWSKFKRGL